MPFTFFKTYHLLITHGLRGIFKEDLKSPLFYFLNILYKRNEEHF